MNKINYKKIDNHKKIICKNWEENNCKFMNNLEKCPFAHGEKDVNQNECFNGIYCWDEDCIFKHSEKWNPENNKKECFICLDQKKVCDKNNKRYRHIYSIAKDAKEMKIIKHIQEIPKENEFPDLIKDVNVKNDNFSNNTKFKYSDVLTSNFKNVLNINKNNKNEGIDNINDANELYIKKQIISIKNKLYDKYKELSKIDKKDWSNSFEIDKIEKEIEILKLEYKKNKVLIKEEYNIFNEENNDLNILFNNVHNENNIKEIDELLNIEITINGIDINKIKNDESILQINISKEKNEIEVLIENMEKEVEIYCKQIKTNINNNIKDSYSKIILISNLNKISSMINLLKINYKDLSNK
jgi:hypothetical protein